MAEVFRPTEESVIEAERNQQLNKLFDDTLRNRVGNRPGYTWKKIIQENVMEEKSLTSIAKKHRVRVSAVSSKKQNGLFYLRRKIKEMKLDL